VESAGVADAPQLGQELTVHAVVDLAGLEPGDVSVQVAYGEVDDDDELRLPEYAALEAVERTDHAWRYEGRVRLDRRGSFGYTVRVLPQHPALASPAELALVALPVESAAYTAV
jgi:starch phosphorylase